MVAASGMERSAVALTAGAGIGAAITLCVSSMARSAAPIHASHDLMHAASTRGKAEAAVSAARRWRSRGARVYRVVLTGGPCGGKSSSQRHLSETLTAQGYDVYFAPEIPTILMNGGCQYPGLAKENAEKLLAFERSIIQMQMQMEESFLEVAVSTSRPSVVIFDRALLDVPAYLPRETWLGKSFVQR